MPPVLSDDAEEFLTWLAVERGRSPNTLGAYRRDLAAWEDWLADRGTDGDGVDATTVDAYVDHLVTGGRSPASVARAISALRGCHRFLVDEGRRREDPTTEVAGPRPGRRLPKALSEQDTARLLDSVNGDTPVDRRDRALLELLYATGARISEAVGLSLGDLQFEDGLVRVFGKGSKERLVPLGRTATAAVADWLSPAGRGAMAPARWARRGDAEAVFLNTRGARLGRQAAWTIVKRRAGRVGLGDAVSPHVLRHSCASHMLAHGADIRVVQELLGHASISTTERYTHVSAEHLRAAYEGAHPRAREDGAR